MGELSAMSAEESRALPALVRVGRIRKPHGVRGEVAVEVSSDTPDRLAPGSALVVTTPEAGERRLVVASSRPHKDVMLVRFEGIEGRDRVEELRDRWLEVERERVPPAPAGAYYFYELQGCVCRTVEGVELGRVSEVVEDGGGILLELEAAGKRLLVPFVRAYVRSVDVAAGQIELDLPPGMIETCTSTS